MDAALNLFWKKGYHATSLKDIEAALNMRPGSIYAAFKSKESLFSLALDRYGERQGQEWRHVMEADGPVLEALAAYFRRQGRVLQGNAPSRACMVIKTLLEANEEEQALRDKAHELLNQTEQMLTRAMELALMRGELAPGTDTARLARWIQSQLFALRTFAENSGNDAEIAELADDIARQVLSHGAAQPVKA